MKATSYKMAEGVYWVGTLDWDLRSYHGYTLDGTTYNAYLLFGDKTVLVDNVYPGQAAQMWGRIADACKKEGRDLKIDIIVQNHVEKDHSGALTEIHKKFPDAPIYCTEIAENGLLRHYPGLKEAKFRHVNTGDTLDYGGKTLAFVQAPLLHWPDSMFTLLVDDGILFPNDAFGQHLCYTKRLDTDIPESVLMDGAQKFYANLIVPLSGLFIKKATELTELDLISKVKVIAPSHGQIWTDPLKIINAYVGWATGSMIKPKTTIVYDTMHGSTKMLAHALAEGVIAGGCDVKVFNLHEDERSEIVKHILESKGLMVGVPTINDVPYPSIGDLLYYLKGLHFNRTGERFALTFGSMGGKGGAPAMVAEELKIAGFTIIDSMEVLYVPDGDELDKAYEAGLAMANKIRG
ncbi:FprA family A-type flavoprotein [Methanospirillum stamsii]|uniref:MBL fold metallo-hydrolase n=1 Tax=Methanospirillum stamsii TaxID=1277351 RepID=A0A2V2N5R0_9EURY|nr:FprA family A-type flavoprotein [Methanospirillum stamsii]PWR70851.1 MBL fold metallo-hydrolase [Methanospirillum stamsii]